VKADNTEHGYAFWVEFAPDNQNHPCERCGNDVAAHEIRAQIPASYGKERKKDKGTRSIWVCGKCALTHFLLDNPPEWIPMHDGQMEMFA